MSLFRPLLFIVVCLAATGCGEERVQHVRGTITFGGELVPAGIIWFDPDVAKGNTTGSQGYAQIKDGKFDTRVEGQGVRSGSYRIRVEAFDGRPANELPFGRPLLSEPHEMGHEFAAADAELTVEIPGPGKKRS